MKHLFFIFIFTVILTGCTKHNKYDESLRTQKSIIEGKIENREVYPDLEQLEIVVNDFGGKTRTYTSPISSAGTFRFEFTPETIREVIFMPSEDKIVIKPGDSIYMIKSFKNITKSTFSGEGAALNNEINAFNKRYLGRYPFDKKHGKDYDAFMLACSREKEKNYKLLESYRKKAPESSDDFYNWAVKTIELDYADHMFNHSIQFLYNDAEKNKEQYYTFLNDFEDVFDNSIIMSAYFKAARYYTGYKTAVFLDKFKLRQMDDLEEINRIMEQYLNYFMLSTSNKYLAEFSLYNELETLIGTGMQIDYNEFILNLFKDPYILYSIQKRQ